MDISQNQATSFAPVSSNNNAATPIPANNPPIINPSSTLSAGTNPIVNDLSGTTAAGTAIQIQEISTGVFSATTEKSKYRIEYDMNKCIGAASCAAIAPLTFFMNEENKAELVNGGEWDEDDVILSAAQSCPVFAIKIFVKATGEMIFPTEEVY